MAGVDLLWKQSTTGWLVAGANLVREKNIAGWLADKPSKQSFMTSILGMTYEAEGPFCMDMDFNSVLCAICLPSSKNARINAWLY